MSFGFQRQPNIFMHDTQVLTAYVYEEDEETLVPLTDIVDVTFSLKRPEDDDKAAFLDHLGLHFQVTDAGEFGNDYTVEIIDPGVSGSLSATLNIFDLTITLAHDGTSVTSTDKDVVEVIQNDIDIYPFLTVELQKNAPLQDVGILVTEPLVQTNLAHGEGPLLYRVAGDVTENGTGTYLVPTTTHTVPGEYLGMARFTLTDGQIKSVPVDYNVIDPFEDMGEFPADKVIDAAWRLFEDCFDSEFGGPWLRDMTMGRWDKSKLRQFIGQALMDINGAMPQTSYTEVSFPYGSDDTDALFAQGILCAAIRHLMRSYTEQPDVTNSPVGFLDRKRYQQAWKAMYDVEYDTFRRWLAWYKRRLFNVSGTRLIISNKAGRLYGAAMRTRNAGRGGYW